MAGAKSLLDEFKAFILRGNVLDLAVAVIIGLAFAEVVNVFTSGILLAIVGAIFGKPNFDDVVIGIGDGEILIGAFLGELLNFLLVAAALFLIIKLAAVFMRPKPAPEEEAPIPSDEALILGEIRDLLRAATPPPGGRRRSSAT